MIRFTANDASSTAEELCKQNIAGLSHENFTKMLKRKGVHVNGSIVKKDCQLKDGDIVEAFVEDAFPELIEEPQIVYEDENLIIYNKPTGMPCEYAQSDDEMTLLSLAEKRMKDKQEYNPDILVVPYLCTPHIKSVGGLTVIAKDENTFLTFTQAVRQRRIRRFYAALTAGVPPRHKGELHNYIVSNIKRGLIKVQDVPGNMAQPAVTRYSVLSSSKDIALVDIEPVTNIPEQIQAQFEYIDCPILGSQKFADRHMNNRYGIFNDALWLKKIEFCVGENNALSYLNGASFSCTKIDLPYISDEIAIK